MESDTLYGDYMVNLISLLMWRLNDNLVYHVFSIKIPDNLETNFTISIKWYHSQDCLHKISILLIIYCMNVHSVIAELGLHGRLLIMLLP